MRWINLIFVFAVLVIVTGVEQCPMPQGGGGFGGQPSKSGLDVSLVSGVGYFRSGMQIEQGDTFKILLEINNYDNTAKKGTICVKDNQDDAYGGIFVSGECSQFNLPAADYQNGKILNPSSQKIVFPKSGDYSYYDVPIEAPAKIFVIYSYVQNSIAQGNVNVPSPEQETISMTQPSAPISVAVEKTISKQENQYKASLGITLSKQSNPEIAIYSQDMGTENSIGFTAKLSPTAMSSGYQMDCTEQNPGFLNMTNTKFIKCSSLLPLEVSSYPLLVYTDYGVKVTKSFDFKIKSKEAI
jgi:hypothetical protein